MAATDRRSGQERRSVKRFKVAVDVDWENISGRRTGTLGDISPLGCFVMGSGELNDGETVKIFLPAGDGMRIEFVGRVSNHVYEIGFALRFINLSDAQKIFLNDFVASHLVS